MIDNINPPPKKIKNMYLPSQENRRTHIRPPPLACLIYKRLALTRLRFHLSPPPTARYQIIRYQHILKIVYLFDIARRLEIDIILD